MKHDETADVARPPDESAFGFIAIVVLYRCSPLESATLRSFDECVSLERCRELVVIDHSPDSQHEAFAEYARTLRVPASYFREPANPSLGTTYNRAIRHHLRDAPYVLTLDQDTVLPVNYFEVAAHDAHSAGYPTVMAPNILSGTRLASPCSLYLGWGRRWSSPRSGWQSLRRSSMINSAAWIHRRVFLSFGIWYNEQMRLYGIDTDIFYRIAQRDPKFWVLGLSLSHDLSFDSADLEDKIKKLSAILDANRQIYSDEPVWKRLAVRLLSGVVRFVYAIRYRSLRFL